MKKVFWGIVFSLTLIFALAIFGASAAQEGNPVYSADTFLAMTPGNSYYLTNDIDLGGRTFTNYIFSEFHGKIDGNGYSVYNFNLTGDANNASDVGIIIKGNNGGDLEICDINFGTAESHIKVENLVISGKSYGVLIAANANANHCTLRNVSVYADVNAPLPISAKTNLGGFIGYCRRATFENCKMYGSITCGSSVTEFATAYRNAGGLIGAIKGEVTLINCENHADITNAPGSAEIRAAGIAAYADTVAPVITGCKNYGNISCLDYEDYSKYGWFSSGSFCAGIIGYVNYVASTITDCENHGKLFGTNAVAPILAAANSDNNRDTLTHTITNCVNTGTYTGNATYSGEIFGHNHENTVVTVSGCVNSGATEDFTPQTVATTEPSNDTTAPEETTDEVTTTEKAPESVNTPAETTTKAPAVTTAPSTTTPDNTKTSGCGGITGIASVFVVVVSIFGVAIIKKN